MAAQRRGRWPWGSLMLALLLFVVGLAVILAVPASPVNSQHTSSITTPGTVSLPPTAPAPGTAAPTASPTR
jgi:hypothetical protein